jgi:hypothetical protein
MTTTKPIHTLNARGNVMLEVMRDYFKLTPNHMQREIQGIRRMLDDALSKKGISYADLRSALVPDRKRREIALVFDTLSIESNWYGLDVFERIIPLLEKQSKYSILVGDYLDRPGQEEKLFTALKESVQFRRNVEFRYPTQFYIVYLNNLSNAMVHRLMKDSRAMRPMSALPIQPTLLSSNSTFRQCLLISVSSMVQSSSKGMNRTATIART